MKEEWLIVEVKPDETFGEVGTVIAKVDGKFYADAFVTGVERMQFRGEMKGKPCLMYCRADKLNQAASSYGFRIAE